MKLTKLQRYTIYCILMEELENYNPSKFNSDGLCYLLYNSLGFDAFFKKYDDCLEMLPELSNKKPDTTSLFDLWFDIPIKHKEGRDLRIELLRQCIIETHP